MTPSTNIVEKLPPVKVQTSMNLCPPQDFCTFGILRKKLSRGV